MTSIPADGRAGPDPQVAAALEAVLLLAEEPVPPDVLASVIGAPAEAVRSACEALAAEYESQGRGFVLARVAGGYRYQTAPEQDRYVERFVREGHGARLSAAALETLAVVAYKQPVSRHQVAEIRGVNVDSVIRTLRLRGYIDEVARAPGPGQAVLYGTTPQFLEHLGLDSLSELPPLGEFVPHTAAVEAMERRLRAVPDPDGQDPHGQDPHGQDPHGQDPDGQDSDGQDPHGHGDQDDPDDPGP